MVCELYEECLGRQPLGSPHALERSRPRLCRLNPNDDPYKAAKECMTTISKSNRLGRFGTRDQIAKSVVFLASNDSSYIRERNCLWLAASRTCSPLVTDGHGIKNSWTAVKPAVRFIPRREIWPRPLVKCSSRR